MQIRHGVRGVGQPEETALIEQIPAHRQDGLPDALSAAQVFEKAFGGLVAKFNGHFDFGADDAANHKIAECADEVEG